MGVESESNGRGAPLGKVDLVALMIDGTKHPLALVEGHTENTTVVTDLLTDLRRRGLDTTRPILVGIDGGKALHAGRCTNCETSPTSCPTTSPRQ